MIGWIVLGATVLFFLSITGVLVWRWKRPPKLSVEYFQEQWKQLQKMLSNPERWDVAVVEADNLLDAALKKSRFRGGGTGERLVKAQKLFTDNDNVWFGHKLRGKIEAEPDFKLKESEVKQALLGIRQALKDLGALK